MEYGTKAARAALADAGLEWSAIQSVVGANTVRCGYPGQVAGATFAKALGWQGARVTSVYAACASGARAIDTARAQILSGMADTVLVVGSDAAPKGFFAPAGGGRPDDPDWLRFRVLGATNPAYFGLWARRRMALYGDTAEDFARVKVKNAAAGAANRYARYRSPVTAEEVAASPVVADPLRLLDICATSDGAAALVLGSVETARRLGMARPVRIRAVSSVSPTHPRTALDLPDIATDSAPPGSPSPIRSGPPSRGRRTRRRVLDRRICRWPRCTTCPPPWSWSGTRTWGCARPGRAPSCCARGRRRRAGGFRSIRAGVLRPSGRRFRRRLSPRCAS
ncbi:hypothetical protein SVIO_018960 [Streptomyces violaceusniger]|uniref:Thiolase N-terminal domain-containing protein n=1 Tax=Streptomyces violaceusniger TaxID=68280 RepID=A0A4D4KZT7_STRVO|nr:hypothetical protein SVIO_018960 [Streptomyces violaceusniger]